MGLTLPTETMDLSPIMAVVRRGRDKAEAYADTLLAARSSRARPTVLQLHLESGARYRPPASRHQDRVALPHESACELCALGPPSLLSPINHRTDIRSGPECVRAFPSVVLPASA